MHHIERVQDLRGNAIDLLARRLSAEARAPDLETWPRLEPHNHVGGAMRLKDVQHAHDARMVELGEGARLPEEALAHAVEERPLLARGRADGKGRVAGRELGRVVFLDRDRGREAEIEGRVRNPKAAKADHAVDAVFAVENGAGCKLVAVVHQAPPTSCISTDEARTAAGQGARDARLCLPGAPATVTLLLACVCDTSQFPTKAAHEGRHREPVGYRRQAPYERCLLRNDRALHLNTT